MGKKDKKAKKRNKKKRKQQNETPVASQERGKKSMDLRQIELPPPPKAMKPAEIRQLRASLNASQALFARLLNVSANAVESWEQGTREPRQATLKLLHLVRKHPGALLE